MDAHFKNINLEKLNLIFSFGGNGVFFVFCRDDELFCKAAFDGFFCLTFVFKMGGQFVLWNIGHGR